jgi:hypothetical protein
LSDGAVRNTNPLSSSVEISALVEAGEICGTRWRAATEVPTGIVLADAHAPARHDAPPEISCRAA